MYRIIGGDQQQYGPVSADQLRQWIAEGRASAQTLAQVEGSAEWNPLATFPEFAAALGDQSPPPPPPVAAGSAAVLSAQLLARPTELRIGCCLNRGWNFLTANLGFVFAAVLLVWLINLVLMFIPVIGGFAHWLLSGVLYGGLFLAVLKRLRGQPATAGDVFAGFTLCFVQLMLTGLLTKLLSGIGFLFCLVPGIYLTVAWIFALPLVADKRLEFWSAMELSRRVVNRVWFEVFVLLLVIFLPFLLFQGYMNVKLFGLVSFLFPHGLGGGFDSSRLGELVRLSVTLTLFSQVVLFFNLLFAVGSLMHAYEDLFGARTATTA